MVFPEGSDDLAHLQYLKRVETDSGLVENYHIREAYESLSQAYALLVTLGEISYETRLILAQRRQRKNTAYLISAFILRNELELRDKLQILQNRHILIERRYLGKITDVFLGLLRFLYDIKPLDGNRTAARGDISGHDVHSSGFAGAVGPQKPVDLAFFHRKRKMIDRCVIPVTLNDIL